MEAFNNIKAKKVQLNYYIWLIYRLNMMYMHHVQLLAETHVDDRLNINLTNKNKQIWTLQT